MATFPDTFLKPMSISVLWDQSLRFNFIYVTTSHITTTWLTMDGRHYKYILTQKYSVLVPGSYLCLQVSNWLLVCDLSLGHNRAGSIVLLIWDLYSTHKPLHSHTNKTWKSGLWKQCRQQGDFLEHIESLSIGTWSLLCFSPLFSWCFWIVNWS